MKNSDLKAFSIVLLLLIAGLTLQAFFTTPPEPVVQNGAAENALTPATGTAEENENDQIMVYAFNPEDTETQISHIRKEATAQGMLGLPVLDAEGEEVAILKDIILDQDGSIKLAILSDGGFLGIEGKMVAFDYARMVSASRDGKIAIALPIDIAENGGTAFTYDNTAVSDSTHIRIEDGISTSDILSGIVADDAGLRVGDIENISFANGKLDRVIISADETLSAGRKLASLPFIEDDLQRTTGGGIVFHMSPAVSVHFAAFTGRR